MSLFGTILKTVGPAVLGMINPALGAAAAGVVSRLPSKSNSVTGSIAASTTAGLTIPGFNGSCYLDRYPDVAANPFFLANPEEHYVRHGASEGRTPGCDIPTSSFNNQGFSPMSLLPVLPAIGAVTRSLPAILPGVGNVVKTVGGAVASAAGGAWVVDQMGNIIGRRRKRRTMNVLNPKAATRSIRRIKGLRKFAQRIEAQLPKRKASCSTRSKGKCR